MLVYQRVNPLLIIISHYHSWFTIFTTSNHYINKYINWLVVSTPLKNISKREGLSHILWKKNDWNHQPAITLTIIYNHYVTIINHY